MLAIGFMVEICSAMATSSAPNGTPRRCRMQQGRSRIPTRGLTIYCGFLRAASHQLVAQLLALRLLPLETAHASSSNSSVLGAKSKRWIYAR